MSNKKLVDIHFEDYIDSQEEIVWRSPVGLLGFGRVDIGIKVFFLRCWISGDAEKISLAREAYLEHIRAFNFGVYKELNNSEKYSDETFVDSFITLYDSVKESGFDIKKSVVPLSESLIPLNGAHRIAVALVLEIDVPTLVVSKKEDIFDVAYFESRCVSDTTIATGVNNLLLNNPSLRLGLLWPVGYDNLSKIDSGTRRLFSFREVNLTENAILNLLTVVYKNEEWINDSLNYGKNYIYNKQMECIGSSKNTTLGIVFFDESVGYDSLRFKDLIRGQMDFGKSCIHIADNESESVEISDLLLKKDNVALLRAVRFNNASDFVNKITSADLNDGLECLVSGSALIEMMGGREAGDVDCILGDGSKNCHSNEYSRHDICVPSRFYGFSNIFYFYVYRFVSLNEIITLKVRRNEPKDVIDLGFINKVSGGREESPLALLGNKFRYSMLKNFFKFRSTAVNLSKVLRIHGLVKYILSIVK